MISKDFLPSAPVAPSVQAVTRYSVQLSWSITPGNAYAVDHYQIQFATPDVGPTWTTFKCPGGMLPVRIDGGSLALADWYAMVIDNICILIIIIIELTATWGSYIGSNVQSLDYFGSTVSPLIAVVDQLAPFINYTFRVVAHSPYLGGSFGASGAVSAVTRTLTASTSPVMPPFVSLTISQVMCVLYYKVLHSRH
jgi:hypothetical protein